MSNIPKIRFRGFEGEWKNDKIGNLSNSFSGGTPQSGVSCYYGGNIPFIRSGEIHEDSTELSITESGYNASSAKMVEPGTILYALYGATSGEVDLSRIKGAINQAILAIFPHKTIDNQFLCYFLQKEKTNIVSSFLQGGQGNLSGSIIKDVLVTYPLVTEQRTIASFFQNLDSMIQGAEKKIASLRQMKEASLQAMFPAEGETVPKVRFKGFDGEWKKVKLSSYAKRITRKNSNLETSLPVTIASADGIISQTSFFNNVVASANLRGYYLIKRGEFAYNKSYSNGYPYGSVKRMERYDMGALSTLYIVFELNDEINHSFMISFFETALWHKEVAMRAAEGARNHGLLNISANDFLDITVLVPPSLSEQQKIASYFTSLDRQISVQTKRLEKLRQIKSACLDAMFV